MAEIKKIFKKDYQAIQKARTRGYGPDSLRRTICLDGQYYEITGVDRAEVLQFCKKYRQIRNKQQTLL